MNGLTIVACFFSLGIGAGLATYFARFFPRLTRETALKFFKACYDDTRHYYGDSEVSTALAKMARNLGVTDQTVENVMDRVYTKISLLDELPDDARADAEKAIKLGFALIAEGLGDFIKTV